MRVAEGRGGAGRRSESDRGAVVAGFVAGHSTAGESKREEALYGLFVWAAVFTVLVWLMATESRAGFNTMVGVATAGGAAVDTAAKSVTPADAEEAARRFGFSQQEIDDKKAKARNAPADLKAAAESPENRAKAQEAAPEAGEASTRVTWWAFFGTLMSMLAAAAGGLVGTGPGFRLFAVPIAPGHARPA